ncbi:hypothetical protein ACLKA6_015252 [Drosophila palustris]
MQFNLYHDAAVFEESLSPLRQRSARGEMRGRVPSAIYKADHEDGINTSAWAKSLANLGVVGVYCQMPQRQLQVQFQLTIFVRVAIKYYSLQLVSGVFIAEPLTHEEIHNCSGFGSSCRLDADEQMTRRTGGQEDRRWRLYANWNVRPLTVRINA